MIKKIIAICIILMMTGCSKSQTVKVDVVYQPNTMQETFSNITTDMTRYQMQEYCTNFIRSQEDTLFWVGTKGEYGLSFEDYESDRYKIQVSGHNLTLKYITIIDKHTNEEIRMVNNWDYSERGYSTEATYTNYNDEYSISIVDDYKGVGGTNTYRYTVHEQGGTVSTKDDRFEYSEFNEAKKAFQYIYNAIY